MKNCECIRLDKTNITLKKTFKFIKDHPTYTNGKRNLTIIEMNVCILQGESNVDLTPYNVAINTIYGNIVEVYDTFVKLEYINSLNEKILYTISYDSIISITNESTNEYNEQYLKFMAKLPHICDTYKDKNDKNYDINKINNLQKMRIIFLINGALSREFRIEDIQLVKNLILLESFIVVPITKISGFIYDTACESKETITSYNSKSLWNKIKNSI